MSTADQYAADAADVVTGDNILSRITNTVREWKVAKDQVAEIEARLKAAKQRTRTLEENTIPELMAEAGQSDIKTSDGDRVTVKETLRASIPAATLTEAINWLIANNQSAIVKRDIGIKFGRDQNDDADTVVKALIELGFIPADKVSVHPSTLGATLRELLADGVDVPLKIFGGHVQNKATIKAG